MLLVLLALTLTAGTLLLPGCGQNTGETERPPEPLANTSVESQDIKLLADFQNQTLFSRGHRVYFDALKTQGAANVSSGEGLSVYKGGINEVPDPSFEGSGWKLNPGAAIDTGLASYGTKSLRLSGDGSVAVLAQMVAMPHVVSADYFDLITSETLQTSRTMTFDQSCVQGASGALKVRMTAYDAAGNRLGEQISMVDLSQAEWNRNHGFTYIFPDGIASYRIEIISEGFTGACNLDAFLSEPRDFSTPYFDGDSDNCLWVTAATPQAFHAEHNVFTGRKMVKLVLVALLAFFIGTASLFLCVRGILRRKWWLAVLPPLLTLPLIPILLISAGVTAMPGFWPLSLSLPASRLEPDRLYFYRITSIDAEGRESPPSSEYRVKTGWLERGILLGWIQDTEAAGYRIYRGEASYSQDQVMEIKGGQIQSAQDNGDGWSPGSPPIEIAADTGVPHASRSLRPTPDIRISNGRLGFDPAEDFWVTGEVEFDFTNAQPFRPASFFEIGDPGVEAQFAVSTRFFPPWGDETSHIILIKGGVSGQVDTPWDELPIFQPGSVIRYVAAQLFTPNGNLPAGVHLWYRIDQGEVRHFTYPNTEPLGGTPYIHISKRYFYDEFGNNSICRSFAIVQGKIDDAKIGAVMGPGTVPDRLSALVANSATP